LDTRLIIKNATALGISGFLAKAITAVVGIVVTRYLGPGPFGDYSTAYAFVGTIILFSELGISQLMVQEGSRNPAVLPSYFGNTLLFKSLAAIVCYLVMLIFMFPAGYNQTVKAMIVILGLAVGFNALNQSVYNYYQAVEKMYLAALFQFLNTVLISGLTLLVIFNGLSVVSITVTHLVSHVLITLLIYFALRKQVKPLIKLKKLPEMLKSGLPFGIHRIFYYIFLQISILILSLKVSNVQVGIYSAAYKLVSILVFIPSLMTSALYPALYKMGEGDFKSHRQTIEKVFKVLSAVGIAGSVLMFTLADPLIKWIYAGRFNDSIPILMITAWFLALECMSFSLGDVLTTTNRQTQRMIIQGSALALLFVLIIVLSTFFGIYGAAYALIIVEIYIFCGYYALVYFRVYKIRIWRQLPLIILASVIMAFTARFLYSFHPLISASVAGVVYCAVLLALDSDFRRLGSFFWQRFFPK
jgi:O-antigen/teichoic acid export membrane protein